MPRQTQYEERSANRLRGMEAFDRARNSEERTIVAQERNDMLKEKDARDFAFKQAQADVTVAQRAEAMSIREGRLTIAQEQSALDQKLGLLKEAQMNQQLEEKKALMDANLRKATEVAGYYREAAALDPKTPDYPVQIAEIRSRFPMAGLDSGVKEFDTGHLSLHKQWQADSARVAAAKLADEQKVAATAAAAAAAGQSKPGVVPPALKEEASRLDREYFEAAKVWRDAKAQRPNESPQNEKELEAIRGQREQVGQRIHDLSAAADPRMDLAKKALADPAASEAHKAAAKKLLGIP